ncbi:Fic family protein [Caldalkalibacillus thermarum]|uniref:Fic family protein n=1 Tax=Caldalkalibacillus thermarum TaxID=296745 RepID=UPI003B84A02F
MESLLKEVDRLKQKLDTYRPQPPEAVKNLRDVYRVEWTYHSNAIEGNTLSLHETKMVVEEGLTIGGKTLREHFEAINHVEAIEYVEEIISQNIPLSEKVIKDIHSLILKNIDDRNAGRYRTINVRISGSQHEPVHHLKVPEQIGEMLDWYKDVQDKLHPVELAAKLHFKFVYIHPFVDGNGRTARLLMNFVLMRNGYPPAILKSDSEKRLAYYEALETASVHGDLEPFVKLVLEEAKESLVKYLSILG